jgi:hypothetical protein
MGASKARYGLLVHLAWALTAILVTSLPVVPGNGEPVLCVAA